MKRATGELDLRGEAARGSEPDDGDLVVFVAVDELKRTQKSDGEYFDCEGGNEKNEKNGC